MKLNRAFERIHAAYSPLTLFVEEGGLSPEITRSLFQQGSFPVKPAITPLDEGEEYNMDAVLALAPPERKTGRSHRTSLSGSPAACTKTTPKMRSFREIGGEPWSQPTGKRPRNF